jgi:hypothetical protein
LCIVNHRLLLYTFFMKKILLTLVALVTLSSMFVSEALAYYQPRTTRAYQRNRQPVKIIYVYQSLPTTTIAPFSSYPGCSRSDIIIGGQVWAACNAEDRRRGSDSRSGWFFANDMYSSFIGYNGLGNRIEWQGKVIPE